jgi:DNA repair protein RecO (recombination protein O)
VLHSYPFRETSLIVEVFSRDFGRVALIARGARRPRSAIRGLLMAFQPLELGWAGRSELMMLMKAEWQGGQPLLSGQALYCGYYLNELLLNLLPRDDAHERLFEVYADTLQRVAAGVSEADLRCFEKALLQELGYGLTLRQDADGNDVDPGAQYVYQIERGAVRVDDGLATGQAVSGQNLLDLADEKLTDPLTLARCKQLMRGLIQHYLNGHRLVSRRIFEERMET